MNLERTDDTPYAAYIYALMKVRYTVQTGRIMSSIKSRKAECEYWAFRANNLRCLIENADYVHFN